MPAQEQRGEKSGAGCPVNINTNNKSPIIADFYGRHARNVLYALFSQMDNCTLWVMNVWPVSVGTGWKAWVTPSLLRSEPLNYSESNGLHWPRYQRLTSEIWFTWQMSEQPLRWKSLWGQKSAGRSLHSHHSMIQPLIYPLRLSRFFPYPTTTLWIDELRKGYVLVNKPVIFPSLVV